MKNNLNAIRFVLASLVIYSHSFGLLNLDEPVVLGFSFGRFAVLCFFILSGYLISKSNHSSGNQYIYIYHRILRIAPGLIVAILFSNYVAIKCDNFIVNPVQYINNGPVWTISWEVFCYLLVLILGVGGILKEKFVYFCLILLIVYYLLSQPTNFSLIIVPLIFCFLMGSYFYLNNNPCNNPKVFTVLILVMVLLNYYTNIFKVLYEYIPFLYSNALDYKIIVSLVTYMSLCYCVLFIGFYKPVICIKNDYSYGLYLYGWPISQTIIYWKVKQNYLVSPNLLFVLTMGLTFICAFLSWHFLEKRLLRFKNILTDIIRIN